MKNGMTHIYTGDGKGKTTAAMGLALRALGCGLSVHVYQFCKNTPSGELSALKSFERAQVFRADCDSSKFLWDMNDGEKAAWREAQQALFDEACDAACDGSADLVILDEVMGAMQGGAMDDKQLAYLIEHKHKQVELVLTGRDAPQTLLKRSDYVTEMQALRHPYERGIHARKGVEY